MMVSNIMVINDLVTGIRNDGARCSLDVLDSICSHMAHTPVSSCSTSFAAQSCRHQSCDQDVITYTKQHPHPFSLAAGHVFSMDDFDVQETLGEGFFSTVHKVRLRNTDEDMVVKVGKCLVNGNRRAIHADSAREACMLRKLVHENILALKGVCIDRRALGGWDLWLVVDYCAGGSLSRRILDTPRTFLWRERILFALHISRALEFIHSRRIIHRDLTSMNVLIHQRGGYEERAVVADFGLSCHFPKRGEKLPQVGTTYFMSPECLKEEFYDEKSDLFSFGVILCQLIARIDADPESGLQRTSNFGLDYVLFTPCCPVDTPLEFLKLAFNCCLLDPAARPEFKDVVKALNKIMSEFPSSPPVSPRDGLGKDCRLARSRSDAALKKPKTLPLPPIRKLSNTLSTSHCRSITEGVADQSSLLAMQELARDVAKIEPSFESDHSNVTNPFMEHARYRTERKIVPRASVIIKRNKPKVGAQVRSETSVCDVSNMLRQRSVSLPSELDDQVPHDNGVSSPGGMPMAYRDYDLKFVKAMKRFPSRRHTMIPDCPTAKSSFDLSLLSSERNDSCRSRGDMSVPDGPVTSLPVVLSPVVECVNDERVAQPPDVSTTSSSCSVIDSESSSRSSRCSSPDINSRGTEHIDMIMKKSLSSGMNPRRRRNTQRCTIC